MFYVKQGNREPVSRIVLKQCQFCSKLISPKLYVISDLGAISCQKLEIQKKMIDWQKTVYPQAVFAARRDVINHTNSSIFVTV